MATIIRKQKYNPKTKKYFSERIYTSTVVKYKTSSIGAAATPACIGSDYLGGSTFRVTRISIAGDKLFASGGSSACVSIWSNRQGTIMPISLHPGRNVPYRAEFGDAEKPICVVNGGSLQVRVAEFTYRGSIRWGIEGIMDEGD